MGNHHTVTSHAQHYPGSLRILLDLNCLFPPRMSVGCLDFGGMTRFVPLNIPVPDHRRMHSGLFMPVAQDLGGRKDIKCQTFMRSLLPLYWTGDEF